MRREEISGAQMGVRWAFDGRSLSALDAHPSASWRRRGARYLGGVVLASGTPGPWGPAGSVMARAQLSPENCRVILRSRCEHAACGVTLPSVLVMLTQARSTERPARRDWYIYQCYLERRPLESSCSTHIRLGATPLTPLFLPPAFRYSDTNADADTHSCITAKLLALRLYDSETRRSTYRRLRACTSYIWYSSETNAQHKVCNYPELVSGSASPSQHTPASLSIRAHELFVLAPLPILSILITHGSAAQDKAKATKQSPSQTTDKTNCWPAVVGRQYIALPRPSSLRLSRLPSQHCKPQCASPSSSLPLG